MDRIINSGRLGFNAPIRLLLLAALLLPAAAGWARSHPFMLYTPADVATLQARISDPYFADPYNEIRVDCRSRYGPSATVNTTTPGSSERNYWQAVRSHAELLLLDPTSAATSRYLCDTRFNLYYNAMLNWPGWSNFFGDDTVNSPYWLAGLIVGYDLYYNKFTPAQRTDIVNKLAARADYIVNNSVSDNWLFIPVTLNDTSSGYIQTFKVLRNKFVMSLSALGLVAYGLEGEVDETRRQRWLTTVNNALAAWNSKAMADGISLESYGYDEFMMQLFVMFLEVRTRATGTNQFPLYPFVNQQPLCSLYSWVPGGDRSFIACIPFGDTGTWPAGSMRYTAATIARRLKGTSYDNLSRLASWMSYKDFTTGASNNSYDRSDSAHFFYGDSSVPMASPAQLKLPPFHYFPKSGVFVWRTGWDNMATYFALICGPMLGGHQQCESGTFVIYKGGAPYIAPHYYLDSKLTVDHNVMRIDGQGQYGEATNANSLPEPSSTWASLTQVVADDDFFNVTANLRPIYVTSKLSSYSREYLGFADCYFVRDKTACTASALHEDILHGYKTTQPTVINTTLDPDSANTAQPWSGSGAAYTLKPRDAGPFTGSMTVGNYSLKSWTSALAADTINIHDVGNKQRGYKLTFSQTGAGATSLLAFAFPGSGQTLAKWLGSDGEGFVLTESGAVKALGVWADSGSINGTQGVKLTGAMGGLHLGKNAFWARAATALSYNGTTYLTSTTPVSVYSKTLAPDMGRIRLVAPAAATVKLYCPMPVKEVWKDGIKQSGTAWSQAGKILTLNVSATGASQATFTLVNAAAADPAWMRE